MALIGPVLGVVGLFEGNRKRVFPVLGVCFNGLILLLVVGLTVLGLAVG